MAGLGLQTDFNGVEGVLDDFAHCTCNLRHIRRDNLYHGEFTYRAKENVFYGI